MGFSFVEDFNYPYTALSAQDFWRRWRMSLASWFKDYMYIPLGGNRVSTPRWVLNTLAIWAFTGLWHGFRLTFVLWGLMFAVLLMFEKWVPAFHKLPKIVRRIYLIFVVTISFVLFSAPDLATAGQYLGSMFGLCGLPLFSAEAWFYLRSFALLFVVGIIGVTPLVRNLSLRIENTKVGNVLQVIVMIALLLLCTGYLVSGGDIGNLYADF
jgi:alginate O-acetyltransferase complex protein AlgI